MEPEELKQILADYVATANNPKYKGDFKIINSKFPELKEYDNQLLADYVATANNKEYKNDFEVINSKFPEFFEVKKKDQAQQPAQLPTESIPGFEASLPKDTIYGGQLPEVEIKYEKPNELGFSESVTNSFKNFITSLRGVDDRLNLLSTELIFGAFGRDGAKDFDRFMRYNPFDGSYLGKDIETVQSQSIAELERLSEQMRPTIGIVESAKNLNAPGVAAGLVNAFTGILSTAIPAAASGGTLLVSDVVGGQLYDYNKTKAELKGMSLEDLYKSGQADILVPATFGSIAYGLEKAGLKGVTKEINRKIASGAVRRAALIANNWGKEGTTEYLQVPLDAASQTIAAGGSAEDASKAFADALFSEDAFEAFAQGLAGAGTVSGIGRLAKKAIKSVNIGKASKLQEQEQSLIKDIANPNIPKEAKKPLIDKLETVSEQLDDVLNEDTAEIEKLTDTQRDEVERLQGEITAIDQTLQDASLSEDGREAIEAKKKELTDSLDNILKPKEDAVQVETTGEIPVQPEAEVSREVAEGEPQAEPEEVTEAGQEEIIAPEPEIEPIQPDVAEATQPEIVQPEVIEEEEVKPRAKTSPIKQRIEATTGVKRKGPQVVVDEMKALRSQIMMESRAAKQAFAEGKRTVKEQVAAQNDIVKAGRAQITNLLKTAKVPVFRGAEVRGSLAYRMLNRVNSAKTPLQLDRAIDYVERSIKDIDYNNKLNTSEKLSKDIISKSGNLPINIQESLATLAKARPRRSEDLADFNNLLAESLGAIKSKGKFAISQDAIDSLTERIKKNNLTDKIDSLKSVYPELSDFISDSVADMQKVVDSYDNIKVEEVSEEAMGRSAEKREALESITEVLQSELLEADEVGLDARQKEMVEAMTNIDYTKLNDKQLTFLNNAINNFTENRSFDGVGQYILNEYRIQQTFNEDFTNRLKDGVVKLNKIADTLKGFRTLPTNLKAIMKTSADAALLRIAVGFGRHEKSYTRFLNKMDNTMNQISDLSKKLGIFDSYESIIKIGAFSDLLQHKEGLSEADIQKEYEGRVSAMARGIANAEALMQSSAKYKDENEAKINAARDIFDKFVSKAETPEQLKAMLTPKEAKFRDAVLAKFEEIRPELEMISKVYKNKSFDKIAGYFPRTYIYPPTKLASGELDSVSQRILEMSTSAGKQNIDTDVSTAFDDRLLEKGGLPKDAIVDYDFLGVFQNEYRKQLYDAETMDSRSLLAQSLSSQQLQDSLKGDLDIKQFVQRSFDQRIKNEKSGLYSSDQESLARTVLNAIGNIGNKIALGGILTPWFKQTIPGLASTMVNTSGLSDGKTELNPVMDAMTTIAENPSAFKKFIEDSPVSRRHKQQAQFISESMVKTDDFRKVKGRLARGIKNWDKFSEDVFMKSLKLGDMTGAGISYLAYYKYYLLKNNIIKSEEDFNMDEHAANPNQEAVSYAEQMTSQTLNISASVDKARLQILGGILPFISFAVNSISNASINMNRLIYTKNGLSFEQRKDAAKQLAARVVESVTINAISGGFRTLFITVGSAGLTEIVKQMVADDEEEKKILDLINQYTDEYIVKTWENVGKYIASDILTGQIAENIIGPIVDTGITSYEELSAAITGEDYSQQQKPVRPGEAFKILGKYGIVLAKGEELRQNLTAFLKSQDGYFLPRKYGYIDINDKVSIRMSKSKEKAPDWAKYAYLYATTSNLMSLLAGGSLAEAAAISRRLPGITKRTITEIYGKDNNLKKLIKKDDSLPYSYSKLEDDHATINFNDEEYYLNPKQLKEWNIERRKFFKENYKSALEQGLEMQEQLNPYLDKDEKFDAFDFADSELVKIANAFATQALVEKYMKDDRLLLDKKKDVQAKFKK